MATPSTQIIPDRLPAGIDWADGLNGNFGTASPAASVKATSNAGANSTLDSIAVEESPDSPTIERAEQATVTHTFILPYNQALNRLAIYGRGSLRADSVGNYYRTLSSSVTKLRGNMARLNIVSEAITYDNPPDEFQITPVELGVDILKHPRYFYALMPTNQIPGFTGTDDTTDQAAIKQQIIRSIQVYRENPVVPTPTNLYAFVSGLDEKIKAALEGLKFVQSTRNPNFNQLLPETPPPAVGTVFAGSKPYPPLAVIAGDKNPSYYFTGYTYASSDPGMKIAMAAKAALEIIQKLWRMEDTPYVSGVQVTHTQYWFRPPSINLGGYIEDPRDASPGLPDYFYSTTYPPNAAYTIFDNIAQYNPQCYSSNGQFGGTTSISWLRKADEIDYQRTWFKVTRTWLGAPIGAWDADLYGKIERPSYPGDYRTFNVITPA